MYRELFEKYKDLTLKIIKSLEDDTDEYIKLMDDRSEIVNKIVVMDEYKLEAKKEYESLGLGDSDARLGKLLKDKMLNVKKQIANIKKGQKALNGYTSVNRIPNVYSRLL